MSLRTRLSNVKTGLVFRSASSDRRLDSYLHDKLKRQKQATAHYPLLLTYPSFSLCVMEDTLDISHSCIHSNTLNGAYGF